MALRQQRWVPDTCALPASGDACSILERWDDDTSEIARTHALDVVEKVCSLHAGLSGQALFDALYDQNRRKNTVWSIVQTIRTGLTLDQYLWSFDANFVLVVDFGSNLTNAQKTALRNAVNLQFGLGKVTVI